MSTEITGNLIVLNLQNLSSVDSEVNLFSYQNPNSPNQTLDIYYSTQFAYYPTVTVDCIYYGTPTVDAFYGATIDDLVNSMNVFYAGTFLFSYQLISGSGIGAIYKLSTTKLNDNVDLVSIYSNQTYFFTSYNVINGTTVTASTVGDGLTYEELVNELVAQPYLITKLNVYANDVAQVGVRWKKAKRETNGTSFVDFNMPKVDPMQKQFAIEGIDLNFTPSPINYLNYRVRGNQSVRLFFYYNYKDKLDLELVSNRKENKTLNTNSVEEPIKYIKMQKEIKLPLFELTRPRTSKKISIKEKLSSKIISKDVTNEEIYTAFDGMDFKQH